MRSQVLQVACHLFFYYLGKIVLNQLSIYSGGRGRYFVSNVLRDSWGFGGNVAYTFLLKASGSKFLLQVFFLSSGFFFSFCTYRSLSKWCHSPEVIPLHIVSLPTSHLFSETTDPPKLCVYQSLLNMRGNRGASQKSLAKQQCNIKYLRMYS